jgi:diketogulonate reductase-like aldo/keto reductase
MSKPLLDRRRFNALCATIGLSVPTVGTGITALSAETVAAPAAGPQTKAAGRTVKFADGTVVPAVGQGTWHLGQGRHPAAVEEAALRLGVSLGMRLIDTSGNYGNGLSEKLISQVITDQRDRIFLVSKVEAWQVSGDGIARACDASLARLGTNYLALYLLHWPVPSTLFAGVVAAFERLRAAGKIRAWGVSNFKTSQMEQLFRVPDGTRCATNQVPYSLNNRGIERGLLRWCNQHNMPVMGYSPLGGDNNLVIRDPLLEQIAAAHNCSAAAVALAWVIRNGNVIAIPESGVSAHVKENAAALSLTLTRQQIQTLDATYAGPGASGAR